MMNNSARTAPRRRFLRAAIAAIALGGAVMTAPSAAWARPGVGAVAIASASTATDQTTYHTRVVDGLRLFYREAGPPTAPTIVLLHGFPASSYMYQDLITRLAGRYHLIAPDYPGFGYSDAPSADRFAYTFDHLSLVIEHLLRDLSATRFSLYIQDYGAPIGLRIALRHPDWVQAIVTQSGNAYDEGLTPFWTPIRAYWRDRTPATEAPLRGLFTRATTHLQYTYGMRHPERVSPDGEALDQSLLDRPGNAAIQLALFYDYRTNVALYPAFHAYFRRYQPPTLVVWGKNDPIFGPAGARAFARDLPRAEVHLLDSGHFALGEDTDVIAAYMRLFLAARAS